MNYKKFDMNQKPTGKQNCICWLDSDEKVAAYYHRKREMFIGRYGDWKDKPLYNVAEWAYAILPKRHSADLLPDMVTQLQLPNGTEVFRTQYSAMDMTQQERLFNEVELIQAAIMNWFNQYG